MDSHLRLLPLTSKLFMLFMLLLTIQLLNYSSGQQINSHLMHYDQVISSSAFGEPIFRLEPPNTVNFANTKGAIIPCLVSGSPRPRITWYTTSVGDIGQQSFLSNFGDTSASSSASQQQQSRLVNNITNLLQITQNGAALILLPFKETDFRQEIHSTEYRCVASNNLATIHSRSALVQAVISSNSGGSSGSENNEVKVNDEFVVLNTPAVLKCKATSELEYSQLIEWFTSDGIQISAGETSKGNKFTAFKSGELHISNVDISDLQRTYGCRLHNTITNKISSSSGLAQLIVTESAANQLQQEGIKAAHSTSSSITGKLPKGSHDMNQFVNFHLAKQTTSQVLHSVSQIVASDKLFEQQQQQQQKQHHNQHIFTTSTNGNNVIEQFNSDKSSLHTNEWRLLLPCAVRTLTSNSILAPSAGDESSKLFEMRWFFQASSRRNGEIQKPIVPLEQYAAANSISLQYLNFVGSMLNSNNNNNNTSTSLPLITLKTGRNQVVSNSNNINNHHNQDKSTKFVVGPTFLAIEWASRAQSGRYVCQLVSRTQDQTSQEPFSRTVCDINVIIRQPMKLKIEAVTRLNGAKVASSTTASTTATTTTGMSDPANQAALSSAFTSSLSNEPTTTTTTARISSSGNFLSRAINWFSTHTSPPATISSTQSQLENISSRSRRNLFQKQRNTLLLEEEMNRIHVQGSGLIEAPPIVRVGERLQLDCLGSGYPIEVVKWFKNGLAINTQSSNDFQVEITSVFGVGGENNGVDTNLNEDIISTPNKATTKISPSTFSQAAPTSTVISSLVIRQLQPRDSGLAMFECFTYNAFGDKARAGLAVMIVERQLVDWARSVCLVSNNHNQEGQSLNSSSPNRQQHQQQQQWETDSNVQSQNSDQDLIGGLSEFNHNSMLLEDQEFNSDWLNNNNNLIFKQNNPLKRALLVESEPVELFCPSQRYLRSNHLMQQPGTQQNFSARLEWRRWRPQQSTTTNNNNNNRQDTEQMRGGESRNFNQLFSGDSRFVINGSSLQIRSPSKRHDEAIYLCRLTASRHQKVENLNAGNVVGGISSSSSSSSLSAFGSSPLFELEPLQSFEGGSFRSPSDSLLDLNLVHQSSLASSSSVSPTSTMSSTCINSMQAIFGQQTTTVAGAAATTTTSKQQQDYSDQLTLAMSSISIKIVAKPKIDPFEFSRSLEEGMRAVVVCAVISGHSPVDITWFKDGFLLVADPDQDDSLSVDQSDGFSSTLKFHKIKAGHSGLYTCVAANAFAATNHTSRLTVNVAPYFIDAPKNTQAVLNSNVLVNCRAGGQPTPQIRWRKLVQIGGNSGSKALQTPSSGGKVDFYDLETIPQMAPTMPQHQQQQQTLSSISGGIGGAGSNKYEFRVITSNSHIQILENGSMIIKDVESSDSSRYVCQAFNGINPSLSEVIDILVLNPAQFDVNYETISVKRDAMIKFNCAPKGDQPIQIEWRKEGNLLVAAPGSVSVGSFQNQQTSGSINNKPIQQPLSAPQNQQSKYSEIVFYYDLNGTTSNSIITGNDHQLRQRHSNLILQPPQQQQQQQQQQELTSFIQDSNNNFKRPPKEAIRSSELFINYADRTDTGTFVCIAQNAYGKDELTYRLVVQEVPDVPLNLNAQMVQANSLKLSWIAPFDGNLPLSHFVIEYRRVAAHSSIASPPSTQQSLSVSQHKEASSSSLPTPMSLQLSPPESVVNSRHTSEWMRLVLSASKLNSEPIPSPINSIANSVSSSLNTSYLQQQQQQTSQQLFSVVLRQLIAKSIYHIRIAAVNAIGQGSFSPHLSVTTAEEPPNVRPNDVRTIPLSSTSIKVLWRGPALMDEQAPIKGYYVSHRKLKPVDSNIATTTASISTQLTATQQELQQATAPASSGGNWIATQSISAINSSYQALDGDVSVVNNMAGQQYGIVSTSSVGGSLNSISSANSASSLNNQPPTSLLLLPSASVVGGQVGPNYEFLINNLDKNSKYEIRVQPYNSMGVGPGSEVIGQTLKFDRPGQPNLKLVGSRKQSFELKWTISDEQPLMGFSLFYKAEYDDWQEIQLGIIYHYVIDNLRCGNKYQIYLSAFNAVGRSDPSDVLSVKTEGTVPIAPDKSQFFKSNITEVILDMNSWQSGGCSISSFMIQFKRLHESNWFILSEGVTPFANSDKITIPDLTPATWYKLLVTALNEAGSTNAEYLFSTLNLNGEEIAPIYQMDHDQANHHQSSWLGGSGGGGGSSHSGRSLWSNLYQYLFSPSTTTTTNNHQNNESGQILLPMSCILLLLVASMASYLYYSKTVTSSSPNSTNSSNNSNFSTNHHSQTLKSCYQNGFQQDNESTNTTLARTSLNNNRQHFDYDEKQLIQSKNNDNLYHHHHLINGKSFELDESNQALSSNAHHTPVVNRSMLDSLIGNTPGIQSFIGSSSLSSRPQTRSQHGMKLLSSANIFSNTAANSNNNNHTPNSNCTSSSISTHSTNCFNEGSTASSSGTSGTGAGSKAKLQLIDESSMISGAIGENLSNQDNINNANQYYYDTSGQTKQHNNNSINNSSPARAIYSALRANNHVDVVNQSCDQGQQLNLAPAAENSNFANLFEQSQIGADPHSRACNSFVNQRLLSASFASAADLLQRQQQQQQQQQQQVYYQNQQQDEPIYQRLDKFQSYGVGTACKQVAAQSFVDHAARAQTLRFNTHFSFDEGAKSMTLHRQSFQPQQQPIQTQTHDQQQPQQFAHGFYDQQSISMQSGAMYQQQPNEQQVSYEQQSALQPGVSLAAANNNGNNISEMEQQRLVCTNQQH